MTKRHLLVACAVPAMIFAYAVPASAQDVSAADTTQDQPDTPAAGTSAENEIVVTAQGRSQVLADVPVAISAVTAESLEKSGATDIRELNQLAPSLLVSSTGNEANGSARIRGIGTVGDNPGLESSVAVFIDNVYRSRSGNALGELGPIERVEILRGPQGTLGGRNSSAGLISIFTAPPEFKFSGYGAFTYGNYNQVRAEAGLNVPISETLAARVDGVYLKRDGFYRDVVNDTDVNDRDRYLVRGQMLFEPNADVTLRLIGDYSKKDEACCGATFVQPDFAPLATISPGLDPYNRPVPGSPALTSTQNPIVPVLLALGQDPRALNQSTFNRDLYITPGRSYDGRTEDYGLSLQGDFQLGDIKLTSITAYREYSNYQGADTDYTQVDIIYRAPNEDAGARGFHTFTQELRLQGSAFNDKLDWLVGGFYANEDLTVRDNLRFGTQYGAFAPCRIVNAINPALASPLSTGCLSAFGRGALRAANGGAGAFGPATGLIFAGLDNLAQINDRGTIRDVFKQNSESFAIFTHNIVHLTSKLDLTLGLRYTDETKKLDAAFQNDNTMCATNRQLMSPLLASAPLAGLAGGIIALSCQGNNSAELNGVTLNDRRHEDEFTGTAILSYKPIDDLMVYASYSRGYKAGGFNLDKSALTGTAANGVILGPLVAGSTANLQFGAETVNAYEAGLKYATRNFSAGLTLYRQEFKNFQLNTFNGSVFVVQNVNSCSTDLGGGDTDASETTGGCDADNVQAGVVAQGVEFETSLNPVRYVNMTMGLTYADTSYKNNLIGSDNGAPLDPALRLLPGQHVSNAPEWVGTSSISYTPPIGDSGLSGLIYLNARMVDNYNTGSDLLYGKEQDSYVLLNARIGIRGPDQRWSIEGWAQNLTNTQYTQVAFNTPFVASQQTYSAYLAEPRTYGVTLRGKF
ncbi:TonB-dependent receptor [Stakelama pacifica]|uniref:Outer membrane receptor protein involved in Fe transport n=1 Tax=Stakelama pacifica TaxID=517720 RepID=A0A4R6FX80_9SPHN|nr:TonB-dependent receptor [Stakelama pacifica]TDN86579.1 outer membrane receptor protein involved in Fe transport [Stakelama pacifica]GGO90061.1 TonB-dependent receptor [Stakelama pacifica]